MARAGENASAISPAVPETNGSTPETARRKNGPALLVRMSAEMKLMLSIHAENHDLSEAQAARRAIKEYLERQADYVAPY